MENSEMMGKIDEIFLEEVKRYFSSVPMHLSGYADVHRFEECFEVRLRANGIGLKSESGVSQLFGKRVSGNAGAIASGYVRLNYNSHWKKTGCFMEGEIESAKGLFRDRYGMSVDTVSESTFRSLAGAGHTWRDVGIGSCSSSYETYSAVYRDGEGNLMVDQTCLVWD